MKKLFILILGLFLLAGCSQISRPHQIVAQQYITGPLILEELIPTTGSFEVFEESPYFEIFKNKSGCSIASGDENNPMVVNCDGVSGYNYLYSIKSMHLTYLYQPTRFRYSSDAIANFLNTNGSGFPMILSGNVIYSIRSGNISPLISTIVMMSKGINEEPVKVIKKILNKKCNYAQSSVEWFLTGSYLGYTADVYADSESDTLNLENTCLMGVSNYGDDSYWNFIFSKEPKDYYYIIGSIAGGNRPYSYDNYTLKLFVE